MGAFALVWFLVPLPFVYLARWVPSLALALSAGGLLAALTTLALAAHLPAHLPADVPGTLPAWTLIVLLLGQPALAACVGWAATDTVTAASPTRAGVLATLGTLSFVVLVFAFYADYDLHVSNTYVPFLALFLLTVAILPRIGRAVPPPPEHVLPVTAVATVITLVVTIAVPLARPRAEAPEPTTDGLRVAAYNVRMGFGMDGRFSVAEQVDTLRELDADVIALSEVDRGWLLNGGHDGLSRIADRLGMTAYRAPADGPFWGDAVLTNLPVTSVRGHALPRSGPTGAQALEVTVDHDGTEVTMAADTRSDQQIDHILITNDLTASDPANPDVPHSGHRPIAVTLTR